MVLNVKEKDCHTDTLKNISKENNLPVIALVGMPNSGKTTLFNTLTGSNFKTSNYPGATVEYSIGKLVSKFCGLCNGFTRHYQSKSGFT